MRMKYEKLLEKAFKCDRFEDPFGLANADVFDSSLIKINHRMIFGISAALRVVINDEKNVNNKIRESLSILDDKLWKIAKIAWSKKDEESRDSEQKEVIQIINEANDIFDKTIYNKPYACN